MNATVRGTQWARKRVLLNSCIQWIAALGCLFVAAAAHAQDLRAQCGSIPKSQVEIIDSTRQSYSIRMGGKIDGEMTRDPMGYWAYDQYWEPNVSVTLENLGDTPIVNPWIQRAGAPDTRSLKSIVESLVKPGMSDKEKARRLWEYDIQSRFHATTQDDEVADEVKRVNIYGYSLCYDASKNLSDLWRAAGLKVRQGFPNGHSLAEVYYEGGWHLLDSDESIISLLRDNETIASESQVVQDHDLMKRTHTYGLLAKDDRMTDEGSASLLFYEGERSGEQPSLTRHNMDYTLRPGESISWDWNPANRYHAMPFSFADSDADNWNKRWRIMAHVMDGKMTYSPDLGKESNLKYLQLEGVEPRSTGGSGRGLYLIGELGTVDVPVTSAYPVVGGRLDAGFVRRDANIEELTVSISFDQGKTWQEVWTSVPSDLKRIYADLDPFFKKTDPARYEYLIRFTLRSKDRNPTLALKEFHLESTLQMAPLAMPGIALGENQVTFSDDNSGTSKVRITHVWNECEADVTIPKAPMAVAPRDGAKASGTQVRFEWNPGSGQYSNDYEFELSEFSDMRWALSPNFHKLISLTANRGTATYTLPAPGLLNPGQNYYWRVRARSDQGVWGEWSKVASFTPEAPAVPEHVEAKFDAGTRALRVSWNAGSDGSKPLEFRVYGSNERGFSANDKAYSFNAGLSGVEQAPANLLLKSSAAAQALDIPENLWRAYYRVVAVDSEGRVSGVSDLVEAPHPLIATTSLPSAVTSRYYEAHILTNASIGHLVSADEDGKPYQLRFRSGDDLEFTMTGAPEELSIDKNGVITGFIGTHAQNDFEVTIGVRAKASGKVDSVKLHLQITPWLNPFPGAVSGQPGKQINDNWQEARGRVQSANLTDRTQRLPSGYAGYGFLRLDSVRTSEPAIK